MDKTNNNNNAARDAGHIPEKLRLDRQTKEGFLFSERLNRGGDVIISASLNGHEISTGSDVPAALRNARRSLVASRYGKFIGKSGKGLTKNQMLAQLRAQKVI